MSRREVHTPVKIPEATTTINDTIIQMYTCKTTISNNYSGLFIKIKNINDMIIVSSKRININIRSNSLSHNI
jgi:hypothetical protein